MLLNNIPPSPSLANFVRFYRIIDFDFTAHSSEEMAVKAYRPRIEHCLQFTPFENELVEYPGQNAVSQKTALFGQQTVLSYRKLGKRFLNIQVVFQPWVLHSLIQLSLEELTNVYSDATLLLGNEVTQINEQLAVCVSHKQMLIVVENYLIRIFRKKPVDQKPVHRILAEMINPYNTRSVSWYADQSNLSVRHFSRTFKALTGIAPTDFRNLIRLDLAYLIKNRTPGKDWLSVALESGFYDYQHLARNYLHYNGHTPSAFLALEQQAPERRFGDFER